MKYQEVESSNIAEIGYAGNKLGVKFKNGTTYIYDNVEQGTFDEIVGAASVGRTFIELIKSRPADYPFTRIA